MKVISKKCLIVLYNIYVQIKFLTSDFCEDSDLSEDCDVNEDGDVCEDGNVCIDGDVRHVT